MFLRIDVMVLIANVFYAAGVGFEACSLTFSLMPYFSLLASSIGTRRKAVGKSMARTGTDDSA